MEQVRFVNAEGRRVLITAKQAKKIHKMYADISAEIKKKIKYYEKNTSSESGMRLMQLRGIAAQTKDRLEGTAREVQKLINDNMLDVAQTVINDNELLLKKMGFDNEFVRGAYSYVPAEAVAEIITGKIYEGRWSLSHAIWDNFALESGDINKIVANGLAANKTTYEIAKDLEKYVNPSAAKEWPWSKVYPGSKKKIDYNAQRLARTMVSHAFQEAFVRATKNNPFVTSYRWLISNSDRVCDLCKSRANQVYKKNELPLDHPNGMCTFEAIIEDSYTDIADNIASWVNSPGGTFPAIDRFMDDVKKRYNL